jgi:hypothetical protein
MQVKVDECQAKLSEYLQNSGPAAGLAPNPNFDASKLPDTITELKDFHIVSFILFNGMCMMRKCVASEHEIFSSRSC